MSKKPIVYAIDASPPFRTVQLTIYALGIEDDVEFKYISVPNQDHLKEEYLRKNPQHTIPLLEIDDGKYIADSHAIAAYLVGKYGKNDNLYPKDLYLRAQVDRFLHFESGLLFSEMRLMGAYLREHKPNESIPEHFKEHFETNFELLNTFLKDRKYIIGDQLTIADFSLLATISSLDAVFQLNGEKFPNLAKWFNNLKHLPYYQKANQKGIEDLKEFFKAFMKQ